MKKKNILKPVLILSAFLLGFGVNAQSSKFWSRVSTTETQSKQLTDRKTTPQDFQTFTLSTSALKSELAQAPARFSGQSNVVIELPTNNGDLQKFRVYEASVMEATLQAQHPDIRSYVAQGIDDPSAIARFSVSSIGLHARITSAHYTTVYVDPYTQDKNYYISYNTRSLPADPSGFECLVEDTVSHNIPAEQKNADDGKLRTFRLAVATTGEYSTYHLNQQGVPSNATDAVKKAAVLSAINTTMTRVNGVYEKDLSVTMILVNNNTDIIYLNAASDPFTNNNAGTLIGESQTVIDQQIGNGNYDIGHTFSTGAGGLAGLRVPCVTGQKARGVTGTNAPIGDFYDIDYVAHEMGHQFGANHTFNNSCGNNRNGSTAVEPGSGSTIMAYAGICPPNVQSHSDDYFTAVSIQEMWNNVSGGSGQCGVQTDTNNLPPTADAGPNYTIPKSTPFILKGIATDPNGGDVLSHCWEQMDVPPAQMPPVNTSTLGPAFRSNSPIASPDRYMPSLNTVLIGQTQNLWEVVPAVGRLMNFRYTVRDNVAGGASTASDNVAITVNGNSGPFVVTSQNTATTWQTRTFETITWDVAGTDIAPVDSPNVDILFSTDGGQTYPIVIADDIPNNGTADVYVPIVNTTTGRFMIISSNNIFYDINGGIITVQGSLSTDDFAFDNFAVWPNPSSGTFNLSFTPASNDKIEVSLYDLRGRLINQYNFDDVSASGIFNKSLDYNAIDSGMYFLVVKNGNKVTNKRLIKN